jgi:hypothetical protein
VSVQRQQNVVELQVTVTTSVLTPPQTLQLGVPVDDPIGMEIFQCQQNFGRIKLGLTERELLSLDV